MYMVTVVTMFYFFIIVNKNIYIVTCAQFRNFWIFYDFDLLRSNPKIKILSRLLVFTNGCRVTGFYINNAEKQNTF